MCAVNRGAVQHTHAEAKPPGNVLQMRANAAPQQIKYVECTKFVRLTHNKNPVRQVHARPGDEEMDTEGDALSGVSRKRSIRSNPCWFTEFCKSQCLSHFAAPFIVVRAETSVAESCEEAFKQLGGKHQGRDSKTQGLVEDSDGRAEEEIHS